jgi:hypothetical protein
MEMWLLVEETNTLPSAAAPVLAVADDTTADVVLVGVFGTGVVIVKESNNERVRSVNCIIPCLYWSASVNIKMFI